MKIKNLPDGASIEESEYGDHVLISACAPEGFVWKAEGLGVINLGYYPKHPEYGTRGKCFKSLQTKINKGLLEL